MSGSSEVNILLVEDNPDHAHFTLKTLTKHNGVRTYWVKDGEEALDFLHQRGQWAEAKSAPRPGLILLDIHLPKLNGHGVLREVKTNEALRTIPVVMLTTSDRGDEIQAAYSEGANSYVSKPMDFWQFSERIGTLKQYWVRTSELPAA